MTETEPKLKEYMKAYQIAYGALVKILQQKPSSCMSKSIATKAIGKMAEVFAEEIKHGRP